MKIINFIFFLVLIVTFFSCKNELKINAPYKEIPSIYAVLNPQETIQIIRVNKVFLGDGDANQIFPMDDVLLHDKKARAKKAILGDIIVCPGVALKDAKSESTNPAFHLVFLIAHGILHLLGQDHQEDSQRGLMQKKEQGIMNSLRVSKKHL
jgi:rRNA maturation RNase YbeY